MARNIPQKIAGRAFRRFNHTLNARSAYADSTTDHIKGPIALLGFIFFGSYSAFIWTLRNYETRRQRLVIRPLVALLFFALQFFTLAFLWLCFSALIGSWPVQAGIVGDIVSVMVATSAIALGLLGEILYLCLITLPASLFEDRTDWINGSVLPRLIEGDLPRLNKRIPAGQTSLAAIAAVVAYTIFLGMAFVEALQQRVTRKFAWATIAANREFLAKNHLADHDTTDMRDDAGRKYVLVTIRDDHAEFFAFGTPNQRMLLTFDPANGAFNEWGTLEALRPKWAEDRAAADAKPKGLHGRRSKFPRGPATKKKGAQKAYGWTSRP